MKLFDIELQNLKKRDILEKIDLFLSNPGSMMHIVSLNAENLIIAQKDKDFRLILQAADIKLNDGAGVILGAKIKENISLQRYTGVDLMQDLIAHIGIRRLRVLLLGGKQNLADKIVKCYKQKGTNVQFLCVNGIKDIRKYQEADEGKLVLKKVRDFKPHIIFAAFGSPFQEKWFWNHRNELKGVVCMGVGGAFDFIAGTSKRAPVFIQNVGFEWLYRLINEPWRWRRQLRLIPFMWQIIIGKA